MTVIDQDHPWGRDDESGAANFVDEAAVLRGVRSVVRGVRVPLAATVEPGRGFGLVGRPAPQHYMLRTGADYRAGLSEHAGFGFADDVISLPTHGATHVDALSHVWRHGVMYNGFSSDVVTSRGAKRLGIEKMPPIATRGVVIDCAPAQTRSVDDPVRVDELRALVAATQIKLEPGDALLLRTGWLEATRSGRSDAAAWPGLHHDCGDWLAEQRLCLLGADNPGVEVFPSFDTTCQVPLHLQLIGKHGTYFSELLDLESLIALRQPTFQLVLAPIPVRGAVGSPVAPVAVL